MKTCFAKLYQKVISNGSAIETYWNYFREIRIVAVELVCQIRGVGMMQWSTFPRSSVAGRNNFPVRFTLVPDHRNQENPEFKMTAPPMLVGIFHDTTIYNSATTNYNTQFVAAQRGLTWNGHLAQFGNRPGYPSMVAPFHSSPFSRQWWPRAFGRCRRGPWGLSGAWEDVQTLWLFDGLAGLENWIPSWQDATQCRIVDMYCTCIFYLWFNKYMLLRIVWLCKAGDATRHETIVSVLGLAHRHSPGAEIWSHAPCPPQGIEPLSFGTPSLSPCPNPESKLFL